LPDDAGLELPGIVVVPDLLDPELFPPRLDDLDDVLDVLSLDDVLVIGVELNEAGVLGVPHDVVVPELSEDLGDLLSMVAAHELLSDSAFKEYPCHVLEVSLVADVVGEVEREYSGSVKLVHVD
jgi:hypothetical protein